MGFLIFLFFSSIQTSRNSLINSIVFSCQVFANSAFCPLHFFFLKNLYKFCLQRFPYRFRGLPPQKTGCKWKRCSETSQWCIKWGSKNILLCGVVVLKAFSNNVADTEASLGKSSGSNCIISLPVVLPPLVASSLNIGRDNCFPWHVRIFTY